MEFPSLFSKNTVPERLSPESNKVWNQGDFKNSNFSALQVKSEQFGSPAGAALKNPKISL